MEAIYLRYPDGQMTQRSEEEARRLWKEGLMPSGTIYWQEGMPDWKPVVQWLGENPVIPEEPVPGKPETENVSYHFLLDPAGLTKLLQRLLWLSVIVACVALVDDVVEFVQVQFGQLSPDQVANNDPIQVIVGLLQSGLGIVTGIAFLKWIYRAYKNIKGFGAEGLRFSPGWAVGYYFIPILSLIRPVQVMSEIWRASDDPGNWQAKTRFMADCRLVDLVFALHRESRRSRWKSRSRPRPTTNGPSPRSWRFWETCFRYRYRSLRSGLSLRFIEGKRPSWRASIQATNLHLTPRCQPSVRQANTKRNSSVV